MLSLHNIGCSKIIELEEIIYESLFLAKIQGNLADTPTDEG